jgi:hypothetical protein
MKTYNDETLTILLERIEQRLDKIEAKFESKIDNLEKSIFDLIRDKEKINGLVQKFFEDDDKKKPSSLLWIKENEGVVKIILLTIAVIAGIVRVSRDALAEFIKRLLGLT